MKNMIHGKNIIIIFLCVTIIFLAIGFIFLSVQLNHQVEGDFSHSVIFTKVEKVSSIKGGSKEPFGSANIVVDGHEIEMEFELSSAHDEVTFVATIQNTGDTTAKIVDIMESPNYRDLSFSSIISPIQIELSNVVSKILEPMDSCELKINVIYPVTKEKNKPNKFHYKIGLLTEAK